MIKKVWNSSHHHHFTNEETEPQRDDPPPRTHGWGQSPKGQRVTSNQDSGSGKRNTAYTQAAQDEGQRDSSWARLLPVKRSQRWCGQAGGFLEEMGPELGFGKWDEYRQTEEAFSSREQRTGGITVLSMLIDTNSFFVAACRGRFKTLQWPGQYGSVEVTL